MGCAIHSTQNYSVLNGCCCCCFRSTSSSRGGCGVGREGERQRRRGGDSPLGMVMFHHEAVRAETRRIFGAASFFSLVFCVFWARAVLLRGFVSHLFLIVIGCFPSFRFSAHLLCVTPAGRGEAAEGPADGDEGTQGRRASTRESCV